VGANAEWTLLVAYFAGLLAVTSFTVGLCVSILLKPLPAPLASGQPKAVAGAVISLSVLFILDGWVLFTTSRMPVRTVIDGDVLTTYSLRGRNHVSLSGLTSSKPAFLLATRKPFLYCLRCSDDRGRTVFLHPGSIAVAKRLPVLDRLQRALEPANGGPGTGRQSVLMWKTQANIALQKKAAKRRTANPVPPPRHKPEIRPYPGN
jgi:hypothetical protein